VLVVACACNAPEPAGCKNIDPSACNPVEAELLNDIIGAV
jgi:hypothetical protein